VIAPEDLGLFERSLRNAAAETAGAALDAALEELGWRDALTADRHSAVSVFFELQGAANAHSSASAGRGRCTGRGRWVRDRAPGDRWVRSTRHLGRSVTHLHGLAPDGLGAQHSALVVTAVGERLLLITVPTASLRMRPIEGIDPRPSLVEVTGDLGHAGDGVDLPAAAWAGAVALGRLAVAHELVGASGPCWSWLASTPVRASSSTGRSPPSRPSGTGWPRHGSASTWHRRWSTPPWLDRSPGTAAMAKAVAGRQARTASRHCQQVLAGIGFTIEHPLHRYVRRTLFLDALLGSAAITHRCARAGAARAPALPPLLPL